jgi:dTDP-4-dehydrorhamnose 3,5-epimerase-like enzyme
VKLESAPRSESFKAGEIESVVVRYLRKFHDEREWLTELFRHEGQHLWQAKL